MYRNEDVDPVMGMRRLISDLLALFHKESYECLLLKPREATRLVASIADLTHRQADDLMEWFYSRIEVEPLMDAFRCLFQHVETLSACGNITRANGIVRQLFQRDEQFCIHKLLLALGSGPSGEDCSLNFFRPEPPAVEDSHEERADEKPDIPFGFSLPGRSSSGEARESEQETKPFRTGFC